ncbi:hypothetical protein ACQHIV_29275 [Kribbella sp. GL6]|uniref:hypothetical protein n=1 Tax=Kribbella sp. GL6 TaxID=3419765 RepID=UPI003D01B671
MPCLRAELRGRYPRRLRGCAHPEVVLDTTRKQGKPTAGHQQICMRSQANGTA